MKSNHMGVKFKYILNFLHENKNYMKFNHMGVKNLSIF